MYNAELDEDWQKLDQIAGWFTRGEAVALQRLVRQTPPGAKIVELGSYHGRSSVIIAGALPPEGTLCCVDIFVDLPPFLATIKNYGVSGKITVAKSLSAVAAGYFAAVSQDLILVDAAHDHHSVTADITAWYPKLKPGGFLVCHDYNEPLWPDVAPAIAALGLEGGVLADCLWHHRKPQ